MRRDVIWTWSAEADLQEVFRREEEDADGRGERFVEVCLIYSGNFLKWRECGIRPCVVP